MWYDMFFTNFAAVGMFVLILVLAARLIHRPANLPPCPRPWPVVGNFPSLRGDVIEVFKSLRREYGDVYTLYLGSKPVVFVNGSHYIRDFLLTRGEEFADRPKMFITDEIAKGKGVFSSNGQEWKEQRRFTLHALRDFGFGKSSLEGKIMEEFEVLIQCLKDKEGRTFHMGKLISISISNIICSIIFGNRFDHNDPKFVDYMKRIEENIKHLGLAGALNFLPWLKYLPGDLFHIHKIMRNVSFVNDFILDEMKSHRKTINPDEPRDFIDAYMIEMDKCQKTDPNTSFDDAQLQQVIGDLFVAGAETTETSLQWALLLLINNPDVQTKLRSEIHSVIGRNGCPSLNHRKNMPYMEATLMEIQRCGNIVPLNVPRAAVRDTTLAGYTIPRGTTVIALLFSLHKDPNYFSDPERFDPTRFLDSEGNVIKSEYLLPFSAGKRVCPGESLARMELFLFLVLVLQRFVLKPPEGVTSLPEDRVLGLTQRPVSYSLRAIPDL